MLSSTRFNLHVPRQHRVPCGYRRPHGFVLLTVVVMLAICCTILAQLAMVSMGRAREAIDSQRELQQRWAVVSLRRTVMSSPATLLAQSPGGTARQTTLSGSVSVSGCRYRFTLADESSKLPLHKLAKFRLDDAATAANVLLRRSGMSVDKSRLSSYRNGGRWEEAIKDRMSAAEVTQAGQLVTLWGNGRLNLRTAETDVLRQTWRAVFGTFPPNEILDRDSLSRLAWQDVRGALALREDQLRDADRFFSSESTCFSLLLTSQLPESERTWLFVVDGEVSHFGYEIHN